MASNVVHPPHYNNCGPLDEDGSAKFEAIKVIEDWGLGFKLGNALKYICRAGHKGSHDEDLKKALWYIDRACEHPEHVGTKFGRKFTLGDVCDAWRLETQLAFVVSHISNGDPGRARGCLQDQLKASGQD